MPRLIDMPEFVGNNPYEQDFVVANRRAREPHQMGTLFVSHQVANMRGSVISRAVSRP